MDLAPCDRSTMARRSAIYVARIVLLALSFLGFAVAQPEDQSLRAAAQQIENGDCTAAAELVRKALASNPNSSNARNLLGICQAQAGESVDCAGNAGSAR